MMATTILLAPVGAGKTAEALARLRQARAVNPVARVWVLVAGARREVDCRDRLMAGPEPLFFNVEFFSFYQLYHRLLNMAHKPPRRLDQTARYGLLRAVLDALRASGDLELYGPVASTPGFLRIVADLIYELKQRVVLPEDFTAAARTPKDHELARIYAAYQDRLIAHQLVDREGEGWLALDEMRKDDRVGGGVDLLIADGFDQFSPLQARLLMRLADRARAALITLPSVPGREATIGRRFAAALDTLTQAAAAEGLAAPIIERHESLLAVVDPSHPALNHLCAHIFQPAPVRAPVNGGVHFIEAPDAVREAEAILRRVKHLLLDGCPPDEILIALRDWGRYAGYFSALGRAYGLPLVLHGGEPLLTNPAALALLDLVELHAGDFRRRALLDALRSPYFTCPDLDAEAVAALEAAAQTHHVAGGRDAWLAAVRGMGRALVDPEGEPLESGVAGDSLADALAAFFDAVTPPAQAPLRTYIRWLDRLIGPDEEADPDTVGPITPGYHLNMIACLRRASAPGVIERDLAALDLFKRMLGSLLAARDLLRTLGEGDRITRADFLLELRAALGAASVDRSPARAGRVLVTTVTDARGLRHRHVIIPGLSEGVVPAHIPEDPIYLDSERRALAVRGIDLETQADRAADDGLFYQLIGLAHESLTLTRATVQDGAPWPPSHLWRAAFEVFSDAEAALARIPVGAVVEPGTVASVAEAALALAAGLNQPTLDPDCAWLSDWMRANQADSWARVTAARAAELNRMNRYRPHDHYSGRLRDPRLIAEAAAALGADRVWSASQMNDYGYCGFRFFAKRLLRLEALEEPEEGPDAARLGTIHHEILERTYAEIGQRGLTIEPVNRDAALDILRTVAPVVLDVAPQQLGFRETALWGAEREGIVRRLETLVRSDFSDDHLLRGLATGPRRPYRQEAAFGADGGPEVAIPLRVGDADELLRVRGYIDRIDRTAEGALLIDYKTGSTKIPTAEMTMGRNFQMMLYMLAARELLRADPEGPPAVIGGLFWHIRKGEASGQIAWDDAGAAAIAEAAEHLGRYIDAGRRGDFSVSPRKADGGRCNHYCEYAQLCRMGSTGPHKPTE